MRVLDRYYPTISWVLLALMAVSLFILDNAYTMPLLLAHLLLTALRNRRVIAGVLRQSTSGQKAVLLLSFVAAVAGSFLLIGYGGRFLISQGIGPVFQYIWIAVVIAVAVAALRAVAIRSGLRLGQRD